MTSLLGLGLRTTPRRTMTSLLGLGLRTTPIMMSLSIGLAPFPLTGCARAAPTSAPHPLLHESIRWPAVHRVCAAPNPNCQSSERPFERAAPRLIEFWSPSCAPCRQRLQELQRNRAELESRASVELAAVVGPDESDALVVEKLNHWQVGSTSWVIAESDAAKLHVSGLPSLWLVSSRGQLQWVAPARASFEDVLRALDAIR